MKKTVYFQQQLMGKARNKTAIVLSITYQLSIKKTPLPVGEKYERKKIEKFILTEIQVNRLCLLKSSSHN